MRRVVAPDTICVLLVQGALSFSDIDRGGWALVAIYIAAVLIYIKFRTPHHERAMRELA